MKFLKTLKFSLVVSVAMLTRTAHADFFDTITAYRHGNNAETSVDGKIFYDTSIKQPGSVEAVQAYTATNLDDGSINVVHCYSTQNGLLGRTNEAQIVWTRLGFEQQDYHRSGSARTIQSINIPTEAKIEHMAVDETDLTVFLLGRSKNYLLVFHIVPGPTSDVKESKTFTFLPNFRTEILIKDLVLLPHSKKAIFFSEDQLGEIDLQDYPFLNRQVPQIKVYDVHGDVAADVFAEEPQNPDLSGAAKLYQLEPVYSASGEQTSEVFMLLTNVNDDSRTLRIDVASADQLQGSAKNIARVNSNSQAAFNAAHFAEVGLETKQDGSQTHIIVTGAYQSYPETASFISVSEVTQTSEGSWTGDRSFEFKISQAEFGNVYTKVLGIRKQQAAVEDTLNFTVFLASSDYFYKGDFSIAKSADNGYQIQSAMVQQSIPFEMNLGIQKVFFFPGHHKAQNPTWPDFYFFGTTTREASEADEKRTLDGLLISEFFYRKVEYLQLMQTEFNVTEKFVQNGPVVEGAIYDNSRVLPETKAIFDQRMVDGTARYLITDETENNLGLDWTANTEWCAIEEVPDYSSIAPFGITPKQLINYLATSESSKETMFENELAMVKEDIFGFRVYNNVELMFNDLLQKYCDGDIFCASTIGLCFREKSQIFLCDDQERATSEVFVPEDIVEDTSLAGTSFFLKPREDDKCYFAANVMTRLDGKTSNTHDTFNAKKLFVVDPGEPPVFSKPPPDKIILSAGWELEVFISDYYDPEGNEVYVKVNLRNATAFMQYDASRQALVIEKGATDASVHAGNYTITVSLTEVVKGAQMEPVHQDIQFEIVGEDPVLWLPREYPPLKKAPPGVKYPRGAIKDFMMDGSFKLRFTKPLDFPSGLAAEHTRIKATELTHEDQLARVKAGMLPLLETDENIRYISNLFRLEIVPGEYTDPALLGFSYEVKSVSPEEITFQMTFENALEISQTQDPEKLQMVINVENYTDADGLSVSRNSTLTSFMPRQIPSAAEAAAIEGSGGNSEGATTGAMAGNFIISLILAASLNQLWSMMNGLQLACHMPLFFVLFPANANFFLTFLISVATFDLLPATVIPLFFDFPDKPSYNAAFSATGYGSMYSIANLGTCFMLFNIYIMQCIIFMISSCFKDRSAFALRCYHKYHKALFWGTLIRLLFEGYLELCLSVFVSITDLVWESTDYSVLYNNVFSIILTILLLGLPIFIFGFYLCHINELDDEEFIERYGDIYDGLVMDKSREKRMAALFYPFWFCMRRLLFTLVVILAQEALWLQVITVFFTGIVQTCYLWIYQPFEDRKVLKLELMNEITNFFLIYHVMLFSGMVDESFDRYNLGWSFIAFMAANMLVHFSLLVKETYLTMQPSIIACRKKKCCQKWPCSQRLAIIEPEIPPEQIIKKKNLSIIAEEDDAESNFTENEVKVAKQGILSNSSGWGSQRGASEKGGYNFEKIRWNDLGKKYLFKKEKSKWAEFEQSAFENRWATVDEANFDKAADKINITFDDDKSIGGLSFSQKRVERMQQYRGNCASAGSLKKDDMKDDLIEHASSSDQYSDDAGRRSVPNIPVYQSMPPLRAKDNEVLESDRRSDCLADTTRQLTIINAVLRGSRKDPAEKRYELPPDDKLSEATGGNQDSSQKGASNDDQSSHGKIMLKPRK